MYYHPTNSGHISFCVSLATVMWGIGMANENQPGTSGEAAFEQVSIEGDGPPHNEACEAANALAAQDERQENNQEDEDEESKLYFFFLA